MKDWTIRYITIAKNVLDLACDNLVDNGKIPNKNLKFIQPTPGAGVYDGMMSGEIQGFEVSTPLYDISGLFPATGPNPGTVGARYLHYPGWHQPFLITYMMINKDVWSSMTEQQQVVMTQLARDNGKRLTKHLLQ
ncbi:MAG: hypothetical protein JKX82_00225 [Oleispira sp.]|nr:hypothetical protein [Oleispira sp.]